MFLKCKDVKFIAGLGVNPGSFFVYNCFKSGGMKMATSSIFHNVILRTPEQVNAFIRAAEASLADPYVRPEGPVATVTTDPEEIRRIVKLRRKTMGLGE